MIYGDLAALCIFQLINYALECRFYQRIYRVNKFFFFYVFGFQNTMFEILFYAQDLMYEYEK